MKLEDIRDLLPEDTYCHFYKADDGVEFYRVLGKNYQLNTPVKEILSILRTRYNKSVSSRTEYISWKAISHSLRAGYQARDIYKDGDFSYPLKETDFLKQVKQGKLDFAQVGPELERLVAEIEKLSENSNLPEHVDTEFWDKWLLSVYAREFGLNV